MKFEAKNLSPVTFLALTCVEVSVSIKCFDWRKMAAEAFSVARIDEYAKPCEPASIHVLRSMIKVRILQLTVETFKTSHAGLILNRLFTFLFIFPFMFVFLIRKRPIEVSTTLRNKSITILHLQCICIYAWCYNKILNHWRVSLSISLKINRFVLWK